MRFMDALHDRPGSRQFKWHHTASGVGTSTRGSETTVGARDFAAEGICRALGAGGLFSSCRARACCWHSVAESLVLLAYWLVGLLVAIAAADIPRIEDIRLIVIVLSFSATITLLTVTQSSLSATSGSTLLARRAGR